MNITHSKAEQPRTQVRVGLFSTRAHLTVIDGKTNIAVYRHTYVHQGAGRSGILATDLPVAVCSAGFFRAGMGSFAQPANMAAVMGVTSEQQRMMTILWPLLISS